MAHDHRGVSEAAVFHELTDAEMASVGAQVPTRSLPAGRTIYSPRDRAETMYLVKHGRVRLYRVSDDGRTITTGLLGAGAIFGEMDLLGLHMGGTWAEALEDSVLHLLSHDDVRGLLLSDPRVVTRVAEQLAARIAQLERRLVDMACKSVAERTAATLSTLIVPDRGAGQGVRLTHEQLARLTGTTRERTTKALGELAGCGLVRLRRGQVVVVDPAGLVAYADGGYGAPDAGAA
ncbi:CRP-like cAMP-binding protein [Nocardiopsis mwathae]|uniref:CRP-like cAMP-binding protein n=1 Tax=Nocardiopsis mwathae TaxID=1472723 RepID=A0A7W9YLH2_9ACTN|nr:Crp/Fnr family transcriptional regulator [Nocardiopsis mwathae]MBB6174370.1 CRP-like cAMP-binding protein [Nocardiopsis mwathae]